MAGHDSKAFLFTALLFCAADSAAAADQFARGRIELSGALGYANFVDESSLHHFTAGGSARFYLTNRFALEPELTFMVRYPGDRDLVFIPNLVWDMSRGSGRVRPYLLGGVGTLTHWESNERWTVRGTTWTYGVGGGVKIFLNRRMFVAPEARIGWEPIFRLAGRVGWALD